MSEPLLTVVIPLFNAQSFVRRAADSVLTQPCVTRVELILIDVKTGPIVGGSYLGQPGIIKAWHMNKNHWLGVLLDGSASEQTVKELLDISFCMTR